MAFGTSKVQQDYQTPLGSMAVQSGCARACNSVFPAPDAVPYVIKAAKAKEYSTKPSLWLKAFYKSKGQSKDKCGTKNNRNIMRS